MNTLKIGTWRMPGAELGPESPLPRLRTEHEPHADENMPGADAAILRNMKNGHVPNSLPYTTQDGFSRRKQLREFTSVVLENDFLRATFLPGVGGRLWSLVHKPSGRDLVEVNPVFQPTHLALRGAWCSGGAEWNIGIVGHCPFTCDPLFTRALRTATGPVLRMYEWDRVRQVPFQVDAYLLEDRPLLFVKVRIVNNHDHDVPMYWWSNIAVREADDVRVLVPADTAFKYGYSRSALTPREIPFVDGVDTSYSTRWPHTSDFYYNIPPDERPWIAAVDGTGLGLGHVSTARLRGRKLFAWGMSRAGRNWQEFLARPGCAYIEIQGGLARTQMEYLLMPPGAEWSWVEAYGLVECDAAAAHNPDWHAARAEGQRAIERLVPPGLLEKELERSRGFEDTPPSERIMDGSGWGALEIERRKAAAESTGERAGIPFDLQKDSDGELMWLELLRNGRLPERAPADGPGKFMVQAEWRALLEKSVSAGLSDHWLGWYHLGVMRYYDLDREGARAAWKKSLAHADTAWARRDLSVLAREDGQIDAAGEMIAGSLELAPDCKPLAVECGRALLEAKRYGQWLSLIERMPAEFRTDGRILLLRAQAALEAGRFDIVDEYFNSTIEIDDLREGEPSVEQLWQAYHEKKVSAAEGVPIDEKFSERIRKEYPAPARVRFRA